MICFKGFFDVAIRVPSETPSTADYESLGTESGPLAPSPPSRPGERRPGSFLLEVQLQQQDDAVTFEVCSVRE